MDWPTLAISFALEFLWKEECEVRGTPRDENGDADEYVCVWAWVSWVAGELNFSSDIDLIFGYAIDGDVERQETDPASGFF